MQNYQPGEVLLLSFPFGDAVGSKRRPALALLDKGDEKSGISRLPELLRLSLQRPVLLAQILIASSDCEANWFN